MAKIVVENYKFDFDLGCRLLKLKHTECPFVQLEDFWDEIKPLTFKEIAQLENLEMRRIGIVCLGLERLVAEVNPNRLSRQTITKKTNWVNEDGSLIEHTFEDTYELFEVEGAYFNEGITNTWQHMKDSHFVKFKDTSTDRVYMIWVDLASVWLTNYKTELATYYIADVHKSQVTAIDAISWTLQTNVAKGNIEKIIRQGDCILVRPKDITLVTESSPVRHLTEHEYRYLLVAES
jgi:hypothetical protein